MARNGSGTYSLPAGNPVVTGTTIQSTWANTTLSDIATALTQSLSQDGQTPVTANLPMGGFKLTGLAAGTTAGDSVRYEQFASPPAIGGTAAAAGSFTTLSASSTVSGTGFSTYLASPPAIGGTAPAAVTGTTVSATAQFSGPGTGLTGTAASLSIGGNAATATSATSVTTTIASGATGTTQAAGDNSTKIATTAYVDRVVPSTVAWASLTFAFGSTYQNTNTHQIFVAVYGTNGSAPVFQVSADNVNWFSVFQFQSGGSGCIVPVPAGHWYRTTVGGGSVFFASVLQ
ncbi:MAG TPA: hypothetical protein VFM18_13140 [Methanosarcina sp.]|nr:hypothetical protein [Methanosarcina sp.]